MLLKAFLDSRGGWMFRAGKIISYLLICLSLYVTFVTTLHRSYYLAGGFVVGIAYASFLIKYDRQRKEVQKLCKITQLTDRVILSLISKHVQPVVQFCCRTNADRILSLEEKYGGKTSARSIMMLSGNEVSRKKIKDLLQAMVYAGLLSDQQRKEMMTDLFNRSPEANRQLIDEMLSHHRPAVDESEQLSASAMGEGSGFLDLTRDADHTSLGAVLDEIPESVEPPVGHA